MAESLSTTAGVIGIFGVVAHSLHVVYNDIDAIRGAPKEMNYLKKELQVVESAIANLRLQARNIFDENAGLETAISKCQQACETFHANLSKWTKRSEDGKLQFRDAVYFALLRQRQVEILWKRLQACKITVSIAVSGAVLRTMTSRRTTESEPDLRNQEIQLAAGMVEIDEQLQHLQPPQMDTNVGPDDQFDQAAIMDELRALRAQLLALRKAFQDELKAAQEQRTGQRIKDIELGKSSNVLVGLFNLSETAGIDQNISNVKTEENSKGVVGMANNVNIDALFT